MRFVFALALLGLAACSHDSAEFDYDLLRGDMSAAEARHLPPNQPLRCLVPTSGQGMSKCEVDVTEINGLKASRVTYLFRDDKLIAAAVEFTPGVYAQVAKQMDEHYKAHATNTTDHGTWRVRDGVVISSATDLKNGNVYTYWMCTSEAIKALGAG